MPGDVIETGEGGCEVAIFTQKTVQDRHYHSDATEIYIVTRGKMDILVGSEGNFRSIVQGDLLHIEAGTWHQVLRTTDFTAIVISPETDGEKGKYVQLEEGGAEHCWADLRADERIAAYKWPDPEHK